MILKKLQKAKFLFVYLLIDLHDTFRGVHHHSCGFFQWWYIQSLVPISLMEEKTICRQMLTFTKFIASQKNK